MKIPISLLLGVIITPIAHPSLASAVHSVRSCHDGDTCTLDDGTKVRFACVDAPELKQQDGIRSRDHLRSLLNQTDRRVRVKPITTDRFGRTVAELYILKEGKWQLLQLIQAAEGMTWANSKYRKDCPSWNQIQKAEFQARESKKGIWAKEAIAPWDFRRRNR